MKRLLAFFVIIFALGLFILLAIIALIADLWDKLRGKELAAVDYDDYYDYY